MSDLFGAPPPPAPAPRKPAAAAPPEPAPARPPAPAAVLRGKLVTLCDGTQVDSWSEAWRMECFARHVLSLDHETRNEWMFDLLHRHGEEGVAPLRAAIARLVATRSGELPSSE